MKIKKNKSLNDNNQIILYGYHSCMMAISNKKRKCFELVISRDAGKKHPEIIENAEKEKIPIRFSEKIMSSIYHTNIPNEEFEGQKKPNHQNISLSVCPLGFKTIAELINEAQNFSSALILDGITDIGNMGNIMRSAAFFGIDIFVIGRSKSPPPEESVCRTSSGAFEVLNIFHEHSISKIISCLVGIGYNVYATSTRNGLEPEQLLSNGKNAVIIGSEDSGVGNQSSTKCHGFLRLSGSGNFESLNAASASTIFIRELSKKKQ